MSATFRVALAGQTVPFRFSTVNFAGIRELVAADVEQDISARAAKAANLGDLASASEARTNLGATATGSALFTTASAAAARTTLAAVARTDLPTVTDYTAPESEASIDTFLIPSGVTKALPDYPVKTYTGPGAYSVNGEVFPLNQGSVKDALFSTLGRIGDLSDFLAAVQNGAAKVVFWGDSITEGISQITYEDSWAGLVENYLREQFPDVDWTFENYAIGGTGIAEANAPTYIGDATPEAGVTFDAVAGPLRTPPNYTLWPSGTTVGKTWYDHVKDANPDLVILAFGMNNTADDSNGYWGSLYSVVIDRILSWTHPCSVALVSTMIPSRLVEPFASYVDVVQQKADVTRSFAEQHNLTLLDANRLYRAYLEGIDVARTRNRYTVGFDDYADWVATVGSKPSHSGGTITSTTLCEAVRAQDHSNIQISATFTLSGSDVGSLVYRMDSTDPTTKRYELQIQNGTPQIVLYYGATALNSAALSGSSPWIVTLKVEGARHEVWVNGAKITWSSGSDKFYDYRRLNAGRYGFKFSGAGTLAGFAAKGGYRRCVGFAETPERILLGEQDDFTSNPLSLGGSAGNHPSAIGHFAAYFGAFAPLFDAIRMTLAQSRTPPALYVEETSVTTGAIASGDYIFATVNSTAVSPQVTFVDNSSAIPVGYILINSGTATVELKRDGTTGAGVLATVTLTFPEVASHHVFVSGVASTNAGSYRHHLTAWAMKA